MTHLRLRGLISGLVAVVLLCIPTAVNAASQSVMPAWSKLPTWCQLVSSRTACPVSSVSEITTSLAQPTLPPALRSFDQGLYGGVGPAAFENGSQTNCQGIENVVMQNSWLPCVYGRTTSSKIIVLTGDSEAESWLPAFDVWGQQNGFRIVLMPLEGCPPWYYSLPKTNPYSYWTDCMSGFKTKVANYISKNHPVAVVATGMRDVAQGNVPTTSTVQLLSAMKQFFTQAIPAGTLGIALTNYPWFFNSPQLPEVCAQVHPNSLGTCNATISGNVDQPYRAAFMQLAQLNLPHTAVVDTLPLFCNVVSGQCPTVGANAFFYDDSHHISTVWSWHIGRALGTLLAPVLHTPAS